MEWQRGEYTMSDDRWRVDREVVHGFLTECYWARGISRDVVERSIRHSLCFGIYHGGLQVGFARVITDHVGTRDAHGLYARFGFSAPRESSLWMEIHRP